MSTESTAATQRIQSGRPVFDASRMVGTMPAGFPMELNEISGRIIGAAMEVHSNLGPGLREKLYEVALVQELRRLGMSVERQVAFVATYKGEDLPPQIIDTVVERRIILELKSVRDLVDDDHAQLLGYLYFTGLPLGLLLNFGKPHMRDGIHRKINFPARFSEAVALKSAFLSVSSALPS